MLSIAYYLIKVMICSGMLYGYYRLALHNKVYHRWNRFYLLASILISLSFPLMKINIWHTPTETDGQVIKLLNVVTTGDEMVLEASRNGRFHLTGEQVVSSVYIAASVALLIVLAFTLLKLRKLAKRYAFKKIEDIRFFDTEAKGTPFSFFRNIFWNSNIDLESDTGRKIFLHELTHVRQKHSADRLFINIVLAFFWYNPFFWLIRREMNMIHEFIADSAAVGDNDTASFAAMVLQATYPQRMFGLTSSFFSSSIKRRLHMLRKMENPSVSYASRILALPLLTFVFVAFTVKTKQLLPTENAVKTIKLEAPLTIVIDAGHGGTDAGCISADGLMEKDIALSIANKIKSLNSNPDLNIVLIRNRDVLVPVREKVDFAIKQKADAFISIHVNAAFPDASEKKSGFEIYVSKNETAYSKKSRLFGSLLSQEIALTSGSMPLLKQRVGEKNVWVLDAPNINYPSLLIECGYITNKNDVAFITNEANQEKIAQDILKSIERYAIARTDANTTSGAVNKETARSGDASTFAAAKSAKVSGTAFETGSSPGATSIRTTKNGADTLPGNIKSVDLTTDNNIIVIYDDNKAEKMTKQQAEKRGIVAPPQKGLALRGPSVDSALCIVDGVEMPSGYFKKLEPNDIESVTVLKDQPAVDKYGERARQGVLEITLRKDNPVR